MTTLTRASYEWATRPADERFQTVEAMAAAAARLREQSREGRAVERGDVHVRPSNGGLAMEFPDQGDDFRLTIAHPVSPVNLPVGVTPTNWAFQQVAKVAGAPAKYLAALPSRLAAECLNHGLTRSEGDPIVPLFKKGNADDPTKLRAVTSEGYTRVWHDDLMPGLVRAAENGWINPLDWTHTPAGLYLSDRNMFAFMIDDANRSKVTNPQATKAEDLARGFFLWNSEEGSASVGMCMFYFAYVCGNHIVWGAQGVREFRLRHVGAVRDRFPYAVSRMMEEASRNYQDDLDGMSFAMADRLLEGTYTSDKKLVIDLAPILVRESRQKVGLGAAKTGIKTALRDGYDPRTRWGAVYGLTAAARESRNADTRAQADRAAAAILPRGRGKQQKTQTLEI